MKAGEFTNYFWTLKNELWLLFFWAAPKLWLCNISGTLQSSERGPVLQNPWGGQNASGFFRIPQRALSVLLLQPLAELMDLVLVKLLELPLEAQVGVCTGPPRTHSAHASSQPKSVTVMMYATTRVTLLETPARQ